MPKNTYGKRSSSRRAIADARRVRPYIGGGAGTQGPKGDTGDTGPQGPQGIQGSQGDQGDQGPQGDQGIQGPAGGGGDYGHFYLSGAGNTGLTNSEVTLTLNATGEVSGNMSLATNQITINKTGVFEINANVYLNNSSTSRTEYSMWLEKNGTEISGTRFASYQRGYDSGMSSGVHTIVSITSGDTIQIQCQRTDGGATAGYQDADGTSVVIKEL